MQGVLEEIYEERQKQALLGEEYLVEGQDDDNGVVLVACKDEHSCMQLEDCITNGPEKVFITLFCLFFLFFFSYISVG